VISSQIEGRDRRTMDNRTENRIGRIEEETEGVEMEGTEMAKSCQSGIRQHLTRAATRHCVVCIHYKTL
jgi:hypothetical protein